MIDTHCHIFLDDFKDDLNEVLDRAAEAGVNRILMPAINFGSLDQMISVNHPKISFYKMAGIHPSEVKSKDPGLEQKLFSHIKNPEIIAVGETGLDYYWTKKYIEEQKFNLHTHCKAAKEFQKPIVLHNRDSTNDILSIIEEEQDGNLTGVWHCFTGTVEEGKKAIDLGLYLGIGGITTFKNAGVDKTVAQLPISKMVLETDAPYLAPTPKRGKRNEPAFIKYTAQKLADIMEISLKDVIDITTHNAIDLFKI
ncbi:MAG TPA: TatD family hydrolase [Balneolales bacterium]|nr:TatD family hydrolase [Balneolales bacterium]